MKFFMLLTFLFFTTQGFAQESTGDNEMMEDESITTESTTSTMNEDSIPSEESSDGENDMSEAE